jgi:hypothetical protein
MMLGVIGAVIFAIAFVIAATSTATSALFAPVTLIAAGLACLALHLSGVGTSWNVSRRGFFRR